MQTRLVNLHGQDMRISHVYLTIRHIFRVIRITSTVFHNVEVCGMQYHWEIPAVFFLWAKFEYINTLLCLLFIFSCALKHMSSLSLSLSIWFCRGLSFLLILSKNHCLITVNSVSLFSYPVTSVFVCIISCCIIYILSGEEKPQQLCEQRERIIRNQWNKCAKTYSAEGSLRWHRASTYKHSCQSWGVGGWAKEECEVLEPGVLEEAALGT